MSEVCDTVLAIDKNGSKDAIRVNRSDFDDDQAKPSGERQYKPYTGKDEPEQSTTALQVGGPASDAPPLASPSAPHFGDAQTPENIDPLRGAVAPAQQPADGRYVLKEGAKYFIVNGKGEKITDTPPIDPKGYKTEIDAQDVINKMPH